MNSTTNILLTIIIFILLFGAGSILGFFQAIFWITLVTIITLGLFFFIVKDVQDAQIKENEYENVKQKLKKDNPDAQFIRFGGLGLKIDRIKTNNKQKV